MLFTEAPGFFVSTLHNLSSQLAGGDSMAKGLITVGILGALLAVGRKVPASIWSWIQTRLIVSISADGASAWAVCLNIQQFILEHRPGSSVKIHNYMIRRKLGEVSVDYELGIDVGSGMFFIGARPFWYSLENPKENGTVPTKVTIRTISFNKNFLWEILKNDHFLVERSTKRYYYRPNTQSWSECDPMGQSPAVFLNRQLKEQLDKKIDFFRDNRSWYEKRGITYKLVIILYGPPGTGKSRIARYVADRLNYSLGTMESATNFANRLNSAADANIVVSIPDFDALGIAKKRASITKKEQEEKQAKLEEAAWQSSTITLAAFDDAVLSDVLNAFEGDIPINNSVVVMSTNCIEDIDPALTRPSRCDLILEIGPLGYDEVNAFYQHFYETTDALPSSLKNIEITAAALRGKFSEQPFDAELFIQELIDHDTSAATQLQDALSRMKTSPEALPS